MDKQDLVARMDRAQMAESVRQVLKDWLEVYQEMTIESLKSCPDSKVTEYRDRLLVSEAFSAYIESIIGDGKIAEHDFETEVARDKYENMRLADWYKK